MTLDRDERRNPFLFLTESQLASAFEPAFGQRRIDHAEPITRGRANTNFKVRLEGSRRPFVLRVFTGNPRVCGKEVEVLRRVRGTVPVPEVVFSDIEGARIGHPYLIAKWIEGTPLDEALRTWNDQETASLGTAVGEAVCAIGAFRFTAPGDLTADLSVEPWNHGGPDPFLGFLSAWLFEGEAGDRLGATLTTELWAFAQREAHRLEEYHRETALVHGDFNPTNLLVRSRAQGAQVAAVLDWEFALAGAPIIDLANLLRDADEMPACFVDAVMETIRTNAEWSSGDVRARMQLIDLMSHVEFLSSREERPAIRETAVARIRKTLDEWR